MRECVWMGRAIARGGLVVLLQQVGNQSGWGESMEPSESERMDLQDQARRRVHGPSPLCGLLRRSMRVLLLRWGAEEYGHAARGGLL